MTPDYEKLGLFYLGREYDLTSKTSKPNLLLYESKDLLTHAVCVGMTGSGKTGLCLSLLEEAAIDSIPAIAIDPKGDLGNLLLTFPGLQPSDFEPWIDPGEASRQGMTVPEMAKATADRWKKGLAEWDQTPDRIAKFKDSTEIRIYTPGSRAGIPLTVLRAFTAPPLAVRNDAEALRDRIAATTSGLLAMLGIEADPIRSREHVLISTLLHRAWSSGRDLDLAGLIRDIQTPPFDKVGVIDLESFFPASDRFGLAMAVNNLIASPGFSEWLHGEPLDIPKMLYSESGKPRLSIISIAHLNDTERMFFVTLLLNEVLAWIRTQPGTTTLRAILYMDEVFGYFPPTANPPSKTPMLTLLKQARAFGMGIVLATQNPVDLDYKGLSNAGTWLLGRLQTERDKLRVIEGLESAATTTGARFDRKEIESMLSSLGNRVFLMHNVHEDHPVIFQTRWALSFLRGPITREQISTLMADKKDPTSPTQPAHSIQQNSTAGHLTTGPRPLLPPGITEQFQRPLDQSSRIVYRPTLCGVGQVHYVNARAGIDLWQKITVQVLVEDDPHDDVWDSGEISRDSEQEFLKQLPREADFAILPPTLSQPKTYADLANSMKSFLYRNERLTLFKSADPKAVSQHGETEGAFRARLTSGLHEKRDLEVAKLKMKYAPKFEVLKERLTRATQKLETEKSQASRSMFEAALSFGGGLMNAFLGRKATTQANVGRAVSSAKAAGRAAKERGDISNANESIETVKQKITELEAQFQADCDQISEKWTADEAELESVVVQPRKSDLSITRVTLVWQPWHLLEDGSIEPAFETPASSA